MRSFTTAFNDYKEIAKTRDLAYSYISITKELGPSPQLIAFIRCDDSINNYLDMGLESFDLLDQNDFILSQIDLQELDAQALEGFKEIVHKAAGIIATVGGAAGMLVGFLSKDSKLGLISTAAVLGGNIIKYVSRSDEEKYAKNVISYASFNQLQKQLNDTIKDDLVVISKVPNDFRKESWKVFYDKNVSEADLHSVSDDTSYLDPKQRVSYINSGWSESKFTDATKWMIDVAKKVQSVEVIYAKKLAGITKWVDNQSENDKPNDDARYIQKYIADSIGHSSKIYSNSTKLLKAVKNTLTNVSRNFELDKE